MNDLPAAVQRFLARSIDSVEGLEVLLLLRAQRERAWDVDAIVAELRSTPFAIRRRLELLAKRRLVREQRRAWSYAADANTDAVVAEVAGCYERLRLRVIEALYGRREPLQAFSDAFKFRDDDEEEQGG